MSDNVLVAQRVRQAPQRGAPLMLVLATVGFALTFWAWALLSPLGSELREQLGLSSFEQSVLVAVPVIVGSLGRIPLGALTDRYGGRIVFAILSFVVIAPVLFLAVATVNYGYKVLVAITATPVIYAMHAGIDRWLGPERAAELKARAAQG